MLSYSCAAGLRLTCVPARPQLTYGVGEPLAPLDISSDEEAGASSRLPSVLKLIVDIAQAKETACVDGFHRSRARASGKVQEHCGRQASCISLRSRSISEILR